VRELTKVLVVAPFWGQPQHVGVYRVDRFVRWLSGRGVKIVLVRAGRSDHAEDTPWGIEITIRDPLGLYPESEKAGDTTAATARRPNRLRRLAAYLLFNPDPSVLWARRVFAHPLVLWYGHGSDLVLSSSPPESAHVASYALAKRLGVGLIIDMRDGWLDEPLKPLLQRSRLQRLREGRLEKRILRFARYIFVTSEVWRDLLEQRLPFTRDKVTVLTNGYPPGFEKIAPSCQKKGWPRRITLLHAGRFSGSDSTRRVKHVLAPLLSGISTLDYKGDVVFLGMLEPEDLQDVAFWRSQFEAKGWSLAVRPPLPRQEMLDLLVQADGLLLLSASRAAIPSKLFEYIPTGRPILAITRQGSAVWNLSNGLPQAFLLDYTQPQKAASAVADFLLACATADYTWVVPPEFTEECLSQTFLRTIEKL